MSILSSDRSSSGSSPFSSSAGGCRNGLPRQRGTTAERAGEPRRPAPQRYSGAGASARTSIDGVPVDLRPVLRRPRLGQRDERRAGEQRQQQPDHRARLNIYTRLDPNRNLACETNNEEHPTKIYRKTDYSSPDQPPTTKQPKRACARRRRMQYMPVGHLSPPESVKWGDGPALHTEGHRRLRRCGWMWPAPPWEGFKEAGDWMTAWERGANKPTSQPSAVAGAPRRGAALARRKPSTLDPTRPPFAPRRTSANASKEDRRAALGQDRPNPALRGRHRSVRRGWV
jgi:hypothetical protein